MGERERKLAGPIAPRLLLAVVLPACFIAAVVVASWQLRPMPAADVDTIEIAGSSVVNQHFRTERAGFCGIDLYLDPLSRRNTGTITLHLRLDGPGSTDFYAAALDVSQVAHPGFFSFALKPRTFPAKTTLCFEVEARQAISGNAVAVAYTRGDLDPTAHAVAGERSSGDLLFSARYASFAPATARSPSVSVPALLRALASGKPGPAGRTWPYATAMILIVVLLGALGWVLGGATVHRVSSPPVDRT